MEQHQQANLAGTTVDHYAIVGLIQGGSQGRVYRGRDEWLHRDVAIKVLEPRLADEVPRGHLLISEGRRLSRINDPYVAGVYDFVKHGDQDFLVMEYVPGVTVQEILGVGPLPVAEVLRLGAHMARGLAAAHAAGILHCDIKPANLKVSATGHLKILDFGVAALNGRAVGDESTRSSSGMRLCGTVPYMSPEQLRGEPLDERSDLFSAGVVLYEMVTGQRAFSQPDLAGLVEAIQHRHPPPASALNPLVPPGLDAVIARAMKKDKTARQQSAIELAESLER